MVERTERLSSGKRGELFVFGELLRRGVIPYAPLIDVEGIDCVVRRSDAQYIEVQVKTVATQRDPVWWHVSKFSARENYFLVLVSIPRNFDTWVLPSQVFLTQATGPTGTDRGYDLNLASSGREATLQQYLNNWDVLIRPSV